MNGGLRARRDPWDPRLTLAEENESLRALVRTLHAAEYADLEHRQFIFCSGPESWDAWPMTDAEFDLLRAVLSEGDVK